MAYVQLNFFAQSLGMASSLTAIVPDAKRDADGKILPPPAAGWPCLYLLHGLSDDHTIWQRRTSLERYAEGRGLVIIMPNGHRSYYADMADGFPYFRFLSEELPALVQGWFRVNPAREATFVAGLSMGGHGAFKLALNRPQQYAAAASLSGYLDPVAACTTRGYSPELLRVFGPQKKLAGSMHDLPALLAKLPKRKRPALHLCCGEDDFLWAMNLSFHEKLVALKYPHVWEPDPGQAHTWAYWDEKIQTVLNWLPLA